MTDNNKAREMKPYKKDYIDSLRAAGLALIISIPLPSVTERNLTKKLINQVTSNKVKG